MQSIHAQQALNQDEKKKFLFLYLEWLGISVFKSFCSYSIYSNIQ